MGAMTVCPPLLLFSFLPPLTPSQVRTATAAAVTGDHGGGGDSGNGAARCVFLLFFLLTLVLFCSSSATMTLANVIDSGVGRRPGNTGVSATTAMGLPDTSSLVHFQVLHHRLAVSPYPSLQPLRGCVLRMRRAGRIKSHSGFPTFRTFSRVGGFTWDVDGTPLADRCIPLP